MDVAWFPPNYYHDTLKAVANEGTRLRDKAYWACKETPLGDLVDRISRLISENDSLIFWGSACFFAATSPSLFFSGFVLGLAVGTLLPYDPASYQDIDFRALKQIIKTIILIASMVMGPTTSYLLSGCTPGFHTYRVCNGYYFNLNLRGFKALGHEVNMMCWELAQWIPFLDSRQHPQLCTAKANRDLVKIRV